MQRFDFELLPPLHQGYGWDMTVEALKEAITGLREDERHSLAIWLNDLEYDAWGRQMVQDFSLGGRGADLLENVNREIVAGRGVAFKEGLASTKRNLPRQ